MVFVATSNGSAQLWRRQLAGDRAQPIGGTEGARQPAWIAGQRAVSFFAGDALKRTTLEGVVTDVATISNAAGAAWFEDGSVLVGHTRGPVRRWRDGRETPASRLQDGDVGHRFPWRVDEQTWLYLAERANGRRVVRVVRDGAERDVADTDGHAMAAGGWLLYPRGGALLAQPLDGDGVAGGRARPLIVGVGVSTEGRTFAALSSRVAVFSPPSGQQHRLQWFDGRGTALAIASEPGDYWQVRLSPDDRQAAVTMLEPLLRTLDVYVLRNGSGAPVPVTLGLAADTDPVWDPDGRTLLFRSVRNGQARLFTREVGRTGAAEAPLLGASWRQVLRQRRALGVVARRRHPVLRDLRLTPQHRRLPCPHRPTRTRGCRGDGLQRIRGPSLSRRPLGGLCDRRVGTGGCLRVGLAAGASDTRQPGGRIASAMVGLVAVLPARRRGAARESPAGGNARSSTFPNAC